MAWIGRIVRGLQSDELDHRRFEKTACSLLQPQYPGLSPVEGGTDFGRDADIYDSAAGRRGPRARLLATTGDPVKNLATGLRRFKEEGLSADYLVIACSRPVSGRTRRKLEEKCRDAGMGMPHVFGRDKWVPLLARNPNWTEYLLGFRGRVTSLLPAPFESSDQAEMVSRQNVVDEIREAMSAGEDVIVTGVPGVGKSRVLSELAGAASFLDPDGLDYIHDDLMELEPSSVVVDDAHLHEDALRRLLAVRRQEQLGFSVVVVTWPGELSRVRVHLPSAAEVQVGLMRRDDMDTIVKSRGVTGVRARHLVLDQADGRPGWAITLTQTLIAGDGHRVVTGGVLLDQVERHLQHNADSSTTLDAVACLAALHSADTDALGRIGQLVGVPPARLMESLRALATNGLLTVENQKWRLQPGLGSPLVHRWFFHDIPMRSWDSICVAFPDRLDDLTISMLKAAQVSATGLAHGTVAEWVRSLPAATSWDATTIRAVRTYAALSPAAANFASSAANEILAMPRPMDKSPWRTERDPIGDAAKKLLRRCVEQWFDPDAVRGTLDLSLADDRTRHNNTDHPMRILGGMTSHLGPDGESYFTTRTTLLKVASDWAAHAPTEAYLTIWAEAAALVFKPWVDGAWSDPGSRMRIQIADGLESARRLDDLVGAWDQAEHFLATIETPLPTKAIEHLIQLWEEWLRLAGGLKRRQSAPTEAQQSAGARGAWRIYRTLVTLLENRPGLALRAQRALDLAMRWKLTPPPGAPELDLDVEVLLMAGRRHLFAEDLDGRMERRDAELRDLTSRLAVLPPSIGTSRFAVLEAEAGTAGNGSGAWAVARKLATSDVSTGEWLAAAVDQRCGTLLSAFLSEVLARGEGFDGSAIAHLIDEPATRPVVINAVLGSKSGALTQVVLNSLTADDAHLVDGALMHRDEADDLAYALLTSPVKELAAATAVSFRLGTDHGMSLPPDWRTEWEEAFLASAPFHDVNTMTSYRQTEILKSLADDDPGFCGRWFQRLVQDHEPGYRDVDDLHEIARTLPRDVRRQIAVLIPDSPRAYYDLLLPLCGHDDDLACELIKGGADPYHFMLALQGHLDGYGEALSQQLLDAGLSPERIARALTGERSWMGKESDEITRMIEWFDALGERRPSLAPVVDAAREQLHSERERALADEERDAVRGF